MWGWLKKVTAGVGAVVATVVAVAATAVACVAAAPVVVTVAAVTAVSATVVAMVSTGFAVVNTFKERTTKTTQLESGWQKIDYFEHTNTAARIGGAILSLGLTELFGTHYRLWKSEIRDAAGNILGATVTETIAMMLRQGEEHFRAGDYYLARNCFTAVSQNYTDEMGNEKAAVLKNINNASAEIQYKSGLESVKRGEYSAAIDSFKAADFLSSMNDRKLTFIRARNNAIAEELHRKGQQLVNSKRENDYPLAKELFVQALHKCSPDYEGREKFKRSGESTTAIIERIKNEKRAAELFKEASQLFEKACDQENLEHVEESTRCFEESNGKFKEAVNLIPHNADYRRWATICKTKMEGNDLYNRMSNLAREGNSFSRQKKYREARINYKMARNLSLQAEEKFKEIQVHGCKDSKGWLADARKATEFLTKIEYTTSLHVPSQKIHERQKQASIVRNDATHIFTMQNG